MAKNYEIFVSWKMSRMIEIEAETEEEARAEVNAWWKKTPSSLCGGSYADCSFKINFIAEEVDEK